MSNSRAFCEHLLTTVRQITRASRPSQSSSYASDRRMLFGTTCMNLAFASLRQQQSRKVYTFLDSSSVPINETKRHLHTLSRLFNGPGSWLGRGNPACATAQYRLRAFPADVPVRRRCHTACARLLRRLAGGLCDATASCCTFQYVKVRSAICEGLTER